MTDDFQDTRSPHDLKQLLAETLELHRQTKRRIRSQLFTKLILWKHDIEEPLPTPAEFEPVLQSFSN